MERSQKLVALNVKVRGAYYTPPEVAQTLVNRVVRNCEDKLLDPSCGDGQFLSLHPRSTGVEQDQHAAVLASRRALGLFVHIEDFFSWAQWTNQRFDCAAGNPPFIRYQSFTGEVRRRAVELCSSLGAKFTALSSSWPLFLVVTASLLKPGGRMAFVVPAEIGHAPYAAPLLSYLARSFRHVKLVAIRDSVFPSLSQDVWLLYADGFGGNTSRIALSIWSKFRKTALPPRPNRIITTADWAQWSYRLRPFLLADHTRDLYRELATDRAAYRIADAARVGIGYVTGANAFFHLRPSEARTNHLPEDLLVPAVLNGRMLPDKEVSDATVAQWMASDQRCLLLRIRPQDALSVAVRRYLESEAAQAARKAYKCRSRNPWYVVPDVTIPDGFLSYMSGKGPSLVFNRARAVGTNSLLVVRMKPGHSFTVLQDAWQHPLVSFSAEVEGHALGGGMLKLEPGEAARVLLPRPTLRLAANDRQLLLDGCDELRRWRHYG